MIAPKRPERIAILVILVIALLAALVAARWVRRDDRSPQRVCVDNMGIIWAAATSALLQASLPADRPIDPESPRVTAFLHSTTTRCPLSDRPYQPFLILEGPKCPNSSSHTAARYPNERVKEALADPDKHPWYYMKESDQPKDRELGPVSASDPRWRQ